MSESGSAAGSDDGRSAADESQGSARQPQKKLDSVILDETMQKLLANDRDQEHLHRLLAVNEDPSGETNLANHVQNVVDILIDSYPDKALSKIEEVSTCLKMGDKVDKFLKVKEDRNYLDVARNMTEYNQKAMALFPKKKEKTEDDDDNGDGDEPQPVTFVSDLMADSQLWQWAGVGFGQQEVYLLQKSLQRLAKESSASSITFFGKIRGT